MPRIDSPPSDIVPKLRGIHLFHYDAAPCAQRVRFVLAEKGLIRGPDVRFDDVRPKACFAKSGTWGSRIVSLLKKDHFSEAYSNIQPNLVIPALVHDGVLYIESMDIIEYLDTALGGDRLVPGPEEGRYGDVQYLTELGKGLHQSIRYVSYRWSAGRLGKLGHHQQTNIQTLLSGKADGENLVEFYRNFSGDKIPFEVYRDHLRALARGFSELEQRLNDGRPFLTGEGLTMADAIWVMKVVRLEEMGYPTDELFPAVNEWHSRLSARPSYKEVMAHTRTIHGIFKTKAWFEQRLDVGLPKTVRELAHD